MYDAEAAVITLDNLAFVTKQNRLENSGDQDFDLRPTYGRFARATFRIGFLGEDGEFDIPVEVALDEAGEDGAAGLARRQLGHVMRALATALE